MLPSAAALLTGFLSSLRERVSVVPYVLTSQVQTSQIGFTVLPKLDPFEEQH